MGNTTMIQIDQAQIEEEPEFQVDQNLEIRQNSKLIELDSSQSKGNQIQDQQIIYMDGKSEQYIQNINNDVDENSYVSYNSNSTHKEFFQDSSQFQQNKFQDEEINNESMDQHVNQQEETQIQVEEINNEIMDQHVNQQGENQLQNQEINYMIPIHLVFSVVFRFIINLIYQPPVEIIGMPQRKRQSKHTMSLIQKIIKYQTDADFKKNILQNMTAFIQKYIRENELQDQINQIDELNQIDLQKHQWSKEEITILVREWEGFDLDRIFNLQRIELHINESYRLGRFHQRPNQDQNVHNVVTQLNKAVTFVAYMSFMRQAPHIRNENVSFDKLLDKQAQFQLHELDDLFRDIFPVQFELWEDILE